MLQYLNLKASLACQGILRRQAEEGARGLSPSRRSSLPPVRYEDEWTFLHGQRVRA